MCVDESELETARKVAQKLARGRAISHRFTKYALNNWLRMMGPNFDTSLALEFLGFTGPEAEEGLASLRSDIRWANSRTFRIGAMTNVYGNFDQETLGLILIPRAVGESVVLEVHARLSEEARALPGARRCLAAVFAHRQGVPPHSAGRSETLDRRQSGIRCRGLVKYRKRWSWP